MPDAPATARLSAPAALGASLLATLGRPRWWAVAFAAFLVRGGWLLLLLPIVPLPTTAGLANALAPTLVGFVFGGPSGPFLLLVGAVVATLVAWYLAGGLLGAWLELGLVRSVIEDDEDGDLEDVPPPRGGDPARAFAIRLLAHLPTAAVIALAAVRLVEATYAELIAPGDPALAVPLRVALRIPETVLALVVAWLLGETIGGLAVRHLAWGASVLQALGRAGAAMVRPSSILTLAVTSAAVLAAVVGAATAVALTWGHLRVVLGDGGSERDVRIALLLFSVTWAAALWLIALAATWRATAWTFEVGRRLEPRDHRLTLPMTSRGSSADPGVLAP